MAADHNAMKRILQLINERGWSLAEFARRMDVLPVHVSNWKRRGIPAERLAKAADVFGISIDSLAGRTAIPEQAIPIELSGRIPVVGYAKLGEDGFFTEVDTDHGEDGELNIPSKDPKAYALRCEGTSMMPRIQPGEFVIAEPSREAMPGDEVVVQDHDGRVMVKRFLYWRDGNLFLASINSNSNSVIIPAEKVMEIHPVLAIIPKRFLNLG